MTSPFSQFVSDHPGTCRELPLFHTSKVEYFNAIAKNGMIEPRTCNKFNEALIYLFYGRPAYCPKEETKPDDAFGLCPVSFVFNHSRLPKDPKRVHAFDTGAALGGMFEPHVPRNITADYALEEDLLHLRKYVSRFFETNERYFLGNLSPTVATDANHPSIDNFLNLVTNGTLSRSDDRRYTGELQVDVALALKNNLLAVILPRAFLDDDGLFTAINTDWGAVPLPYDTYTGGSPSAYYPVMKQLIMDFYRKHQYV